MKKIISIFMTLVFSFCFIGNVFAAEHDLSSIATISLNVGGDEKEITQTDSANKYTFYYKYVAIDSSDFNDYVKSKYIIDNGGDSSAYASAATKVANYEADFKNLIPEVTVADLESWTLASDYEINLSDLVYEENSHNGYVLAVAAVKDGDKDNVYISRVILETTSETTLGDIIYTSSDESSYTTTTETTNVASKTVTTGTNPNTAISDYIFYSPDSNC